MPSSAERERGARGDRGLGRVRSAMAACTVCKRGNGPGLCKREREGGKTLPLKQKLKFSRELAGGGEKRARWQKKKRKGKRGETKKRAKTLVFSISGLSVRRLTANILLGRGRGRRRSIVRDRPPLGIVLCGGGGKGGTRARANARRRTTAGKGKAPLSAAESST